MPKLADISEGRLITHLRGLVEGINSNCTSTREGAARASKLLNDDPVFREVSAGLRLPYGSSSQGPELLETVNKAATRLPWLDASHLKKIRDFLAPQDTDWRDGDYVLVPVTSKENAALLYLRAWQTPDWLRQAGSGPVSDLSENAQLRSYFHNLIHLFLQEFYRVDPYPFAGDREFTKVVLRFAFDQRITEGKSGGAAVLAMLAIVYLRKCNALVHGEDLVAPLNGTLITGEVSYDGRILPVHNLAKKVSFALKEYGRGLKVILPNAEKLSPELGAAIGPENVVYVETVEQLLANVLANGRDARGLAPARRKIIQAMSQADLAQLRQHLREGAVLEQLAAGPEPTLPVEHENSIFTVCLASDHSLQLKIGCNECSVLDPADATEQRRLLLILLDASEVMEVWWKPDPETGVSRMASILAFITRGIDAEAEDVQLGFLSHTHMEAIRPGATSVELHSRLSRLRASFELESKGAFLRPARGAYERLYAGRRKRVFVLSDQHVADDGDLSDSEVEHHEQLRFTPPGKRALIRADKSLNQELLQSCFEMRSDSIPSLSLELGLAMPVRWIPTSGLVRHSEGRFQIRWEDAEATSWHIRLQLAGLIPHQLRAEGTCIRHGAPQTFTTRVQPAIQTLEPMKPGTAGFLDDADFALWQTLESGERQCPQCGKTNLHLFHQPSHKLSSQLAFGGLRGLSGGWLALTSGRREWELFDTGYRCTGDDTAVALVNEALHYIDQTGSVEPVPPALEGRGLYLLELGGTRHYFVFLP